MGISVYSETTYTECSDIEDKNRLHSGDVDEEFVLGKINKYRGHNHEAKPGCAMADDNCMHEFKIDKWYFKYFLLDEKVIIVSVHKENTNE